MAELFEPGDGILFMKVGTHANESLDDIIERKRQEIRDAGYAMWGYGGNTCHPRTMVQPFARSYQLPGRQIRLVMEPMNSQHFASKVRADEYSIDGLSWSEIPASINVLGSRYALCIRDLRRTESTLALGGTRVALGSSRGRTGDIYVNGRVDKACLEVCGEETQQRLVHIGLVAELVEPFAVFLRTD